MKRPDIQAENRALCRSLGLTEEGYQPALHHLPPGTVLAERYLVGRVLGEGGFGITYIGCDLRLKLKVAVKEYFPADRSSRNAAVSTEVVGFQTPEEQSFLRGRDKFLEEARTLAKLAKQQTVVAVRDYFQANHTAYIVMEYIEGVTFQTLTERRGGRIPPAELFAMAEPLFPALSSLHQSGLIHRDISPENLMLEGDKVRLLDLGCAREPAQSDRTLTIVLKHGYAPLEQYQQKDQGPWTDVYGLCATLYFCLTGSPPPQALDRVIQDELIPPSKLGVELPPRQEAALLKGLAVRPEQRFPSVEALRAALWAPPAPAPRRKIFLGAGAVAAAAALCAVLLLTLGGKSASPASVSSPPDGAVVWEGGAQAGLLALLEDDQVPAVVLAPSDGAVVVTEELTLDKPLVVPAGASLRLELPVTVAEGGALRVDGLLQSEGPLRTAGGGTIAVGPAGTVEGEILLWLEREEDLTVEEGGTVRMAGRSWEQADRSQGFLVLDEEALFADAVHVTSLGELKAALSSYSTSALVIDGAVTLDAEPLLSSVPILISPGASLTSPEAIQRSGFDLLLDNTVLVNRGDLQAGLSFADFGDSWTGGPQAILNYGRMEADLFLECPAPFVNLGELTVVCGQFLTTDLCNLGSLTLLGNPQDRHLNLFGPAAYNSGSITITGDNSAYLTATAGIQFLNRGSIQVDRNCLLVNDAILDNGGVIRVEAGGELRNFGYLTGDGSLELDPESQLERSGLIQPTGEALSPALPNQITGSGSTFLADRSVVRQAASREELLEALADETCTFVELSGSITVSDNLTLTKGVEAVSGTLVLSGGNLTLTGPDASFAGALDLGGGELLLTDRAVLTAYALTGCGGLTLQGHATLAALCPLAPAGPVEVTSSQCLALRGLTLDQTSLELENGVFRAMSELELTGCEVSLTRGCLFEGTNAAVLIDQDTRLEADEDSVFNLHSNHSGYSAQLDGQLLLRGSASLLQPVLLRGTLTNLGTLRCSDLTVAGRLDNQGTMPSEETDRLELSPGGVFAGAQPSPAG